MWSSTLNQLNKTAGELFVETKLLKKTNCLLTSNCFFTIELASSINKVANQEFINFN